MSTDAITRRPVRIRDLHPTPDRICDDVLAGLSGRPRTLPPKYFYDDVGARLFERITELEAYYPTRTELSILERNMGEIAEAIGARARIVELGSGSGLKTRVLLRGLQAPAAYVPVDISRAQLGRFARSVAEEMPGLDVMPVCADYTRDWDLPTDTSGAAHTVAFFPGSTIGNFEPAAAAGFLGRLGQLVGAGGGMLVGADLHKSREVLERAYDDPEGVTARFNLNLLTRIDRECGTDFHAARFRHEARYDQERQRIEMRLVAERDAVVTLPLEAPVRFEFAAGEAIVTEYSHKYTLEGFRELAERTGWRVSRVWTDEKDWFSVWLLRRPNPGS